MCDFSIEELWESSLNFKENPLREAFKKTITPKSPLPPKSPDMEI